MLLPGRAANSTMAITWKIQTPTSATGAIAIVQLAGPAAEFDHALDRLKLPRLNVGDVRLHNLLGVDHGLVVRWAESSVHLFAHGGAAVIRSLARALEAAGLAEDQQPENAYPEAGSRLEAQMLAALAIAASPLAVDLLLDQPRRWAEQPPPYTPDPRHAILNRLIEPPLVVAIGPSNIGKSSLLNALAGRGVSLVADEPGTTRDHVGALIDMAGLVVRYIDTPGIRPSAGELESEAVQLAAALTRSADLILSCGDAANPPLDPPPGRLVRTVALRTDLGRPGWTYSHGLSVLRGDGVNELVAGIRDTLLPPEVLADPRPWRFWGPRSRPEKGPAA